MKNQWNVSPLEIGAGIGLMFVSLVITLIDFEAIVHTFPSFTMGLMIATGLFSKADKKKVCRKRNARQVETNNERTI